MNMKRILSLLVMLTMLLSLGIPAMAEDKPVLTVAVASNTFVEDYETNDFTYLLEERSGVDLQFQVWSEPTTRLSMLVGGNSELPDILCFRGLDNTTIYKYGSTGVFLPLNDYFANEELSANFHALAEDKQAIMLDNIRCADGNIYSMPLLGEYFPNTMCYNLIINKAWLDQLEMDIPTTTDQLRAALEAFAANDMNGNGLKDEIPMTSCINAFGTDIAAVLINCFVDASPRSNYFSVKDGVVSAAFMSDEFRQGLAYVHGLVADGLLDPAAFTQTQDQLKAIVNQDVAVAGVINVGALEIAFNTDVYAMNDLIYDHPVASQYRYIIVPNGPDGTHHTIYAPTTPAQLFFITKDCKDPELAFKLGDLGYDPYLSKVSRHGTEEAGSWTDDPEVLKDYKAATIDGVTLEPTWVLLNDPWGKAQNQHWYQTYPGHFTFNFNLERGQSKDARPSKMEIIYDTYKNEVPEEYISTLVYTEEEIDELSFIQTAINDYVKECITAFATGNMDIEKDWDRYINELKNMDVDRYLEIVQNGYKRSK